MKKRVKLNALEIAYICNQMSIILNSGVSVNEGIEALLEDAQTETASELLKEVLDEINNKQSLAKALKNTGAFPAYMVNMVRLGEITGKLEEVFTMLVTYYENESDMRKSIKNAVYQPIILLVMMFCVVGVLVIKVIPTFIDIFVKLNLNVSDTLSKTINFSTNTGITVLILIALIICLVLMGMMLVSTSKGKKVCFNMLDDCIFTRDISIRLSQTRFCIAMTLMIKSGVDTTEALEYVQDVITSKRFLKKIQNCHKKLLDNNGFIETLTSEKVFPSMYNQMFKVSYKTGAFEKTWEKVSELYSQSVKDKLYRLIQIIEPLMITILTLIIGAILISIMLPLMAIMTAI